MFAVHVQKLCSSITSVVRVLMKIPTACTMNTSNSSRKKVQENEKVILSVTRSFSFLLSSLPFILPSSSLLVLFSFISFSLYVFFFCSLLSSPSLLFSPTLYLPFLHSFILLPVYSLLFISISICFCFPFLFGFIFSPLLSFPCLPQLVLLVWAGVARDITNAKERDIIIMPVC